MKEVKLGTYNNRQKARKQEFKQKLKKNKKQSNKRFGFLFAFGLVFILGSLYFFYSSFLKDFLYGNECIDGECTQGGGLIGSLIKEPEMRKTNGLTNALLIGIDTRKDQPGLLNTDTIMVITYDHSNGNVFMTSLPRDLYVRIPAIRPYWSRINAVYAQGARDSDHDTGVEYLAEVAEELTGLDIHYHGMINYEGFLQVIDEVGGLNVCVENEFWGDYPKGEGWEQVHFEEGCQDMDGDTALKYARTRYANAESGEASDFARARRQQNVIVATKDKVLKLENFLNPIKLSEFIQIAGENVKLSEYNQEDIRAGIKVLQEFDNSNITNVVLDPSIAGGKVIHVNPGAAYTIGSVSGDWAQVRSFVQTFITSPSLLQEDASVYVYNGGASVGAAGVQVEDLNSNILLNAWVGGNTTSRDHVGVKIYDFSGGQKPGTISALRKAIDGVEVISEIPEDIENWFEEDIVIIVGGEPEEIIVE